MLEKRTPIGEMTEEELGKSIEEAKTKRDVNRIKGELKQRQEIPNHQELQKTYDAATHDEKFEMSISLLERMMSDAGVENLAQATLFEEGDIDVASLEKGTHILYKQVKVTKEEGFLRRIFKKQGDQDEEPITTDQVLIVAVNKTSDNPEENTVTVAVVRHQKGKPQIKSNYILTKTQSEKEFQDTLEREPPNSLTSLYKGELTINKYLKEFRE